MTAVTLGKWFEQLKAVVRPVRERWLMVVALASALFWTRDAIQTYLLLPDEVSGQGQALSALTVRMQRMETVLLSREPGAAGCAVAPGVVVVDLSTAAPPAADPATVVCRPASADPAGTD